MPQPWRHRLRSLRRFAWSTLAVVLVLMALVAGVISQLLPLAERHPDKIAAWLSQRAHRHVSFDHVETAWTRRGPLLRLDGLRIGDGRDAVPIGQAEILISQYAGLLPGRSFTELRVRGLDLTLERGTDGRWAIRGLPGQQSGGDPLATLEHLGELQVIDAKLALVAPSIGIDARLPRIDLRLRVDGDRVRVGARSWMRTENAPLDAVIDFDRKAGNGRAYFAAKRTDLATWSPLLRFAGVATRGGSGRAEAWAELKQNQVASVTVDASIVGLEMEGASFPGNAQAPRLRFDKFQARARWRSLPGGWRLDAPSLRMGSGARVQSLDGLVLAGGQRYALLADQVRMAPLLSIAALSNRLDPALRRWLLAAKPDATLHKIQVAGIRGGAMQAQGRITGLGFVPVGNSPGLSGLTGDLIGDADGFSMRFDPQADFVFDWPSGFGVPHPARLQGVVAGWREGAGWRVGTGGLRVRGTDFGARVRGGLWFQGDGTRPWIDLAAQLDESPVVAGKGFWVRHKMSPTTVRWLDRALIGGRVRDGRAVVSGDLDNWPFRNHDGLFQADAHLVGAVVKFQPDWPAAEAIDGDVSFVADGFTVDGKAMIAGVGIRKLHAGIPRFGAAELTVQAEGGGDASKLLGLLRQSPLHKEHGETLDNIVASGPANTTLDLVLPLHSGAKTGERLEGTVELAGAKLSEKRWNVAFDDVRGHARYANGGFDADKLDVRQDGQPGKLSLRAGGAFVRDPKQAFEADLQASVAADALLDRAPDLSWLRPYLEGRSQWTVSVAMPRVAPGQGAAPSRLQLRSSLVGTALDLPAPLSKPAGAPLATTVDVALPLGSGEVRVSLGNLLALRSRTINGRTGVRIALGSGGAVDAPPASGVIASGRAATLDAIEWISVARGGGNDADALKLQQIDVTADRLQLLGASFADTRLQVSPAVSGTRVRIDGASIAGSLLAPNADAAPISGNFERIYWKSAKPAATQPDGAGTAASATAATTDKAKSTDIDPGKVPPLSIDIADLRFTDAVFGTASLRTRPMAGGMRFDRLQVRSPKQSIDVGGDWLGRGASARTRLEATVDSQDIGALLGGAGFGGRVDGGKGRIVFNANWPGAPSSFKLANLQGRLSLSATDGRLLEVNPGAGRVLGLLSIAELPRRLMLDFRDFFSKGFAFNKIGGDIDFSAGRARSENLVIDGPAAEIRIRGDTDLRAQQFDQTIEVRPRTGNLLTVAGALAGGPVGAAIGAAANAMLKKPLGQVSAKTYRVTGPWKEPKVEVVGREQGASAAGRTPPPG